MDREPDTGPVCSCGTASAANPCPKHPDVDQEIVPNRRIELKLETVLNAVGCHTVRFDGIVAICDQPARFVNAVNLLGQLLVQADELIEQLRHFIPGGSMSRPIDQAVYDNLVEKTLHDLMEWGNPPKIEMPVKKVSKKARKT